MNILLKYFIIAVGAVVLSVVIALVIYVIL